MENLWFVLTLITAVPTWAKLQPDIYWNSSNPIFGIDNTDHVFAVRIRDVVHIHCPLYNDTVLEEQAEHAIIYQVSKQGYDNCIVDENAVPVGQCRSPYTPSIIRVFFRKYSPMPNGLEFQPGQSYYFISTSDRTKEGINNKEGGLCKTSNLKIRFLVSEDDDPPKNTIVNTVDLEEDNEISTNMLSPRWRKQLEHTNTKKFIPPPPSTSTSAPNLVPDLDEFFAKIGNKQSETGPNWWLPSSAPKENDHHLFQTDLSASAYEIEEEQLENTHFNDRRLQDPRYWTPMADASMRRRDRPSEPIILFEIQEASDENQLRYHSGSSKIENSSLRLLILLTIGLISWYVR